MLIWNAIYDREEIFTQLGDALDIEGDLLKISVETLPAFMDNRVLLAVFKKQLEGYPKELVFFTKNLSILKLLKDAGLNANLPNYASAQPSSEKQFYQEFDTPKTTQSEVKILPSLESLNLKIEKPKPIEPQQFTNNVTINPVSPTKFEDVTVSIESMVEIEEVEEVQDNSPRSLIKVTDLGIRLGKKKEEKTLIKKINLEDYYREKQRSRLEIQGLEGAGDFSKMSNILDSVVEDDFDEMISSLDKIKLNISDIKKPFYIKKPMRAVVATGFCCFVVFGFTGYLNYIPSYAYRINVKNNSQIKQEIIKINPNLLKEKLLNLSIYSEQQIPKQKKDFFDRAKGKIVLFSTGANSCTLANGGFLVNSGNKYFRVLANYLYANQVTIQKYSKDNPVLTFDVEALDKNGDNNIAKDSILNLSTIYKENLSKNCFAKTTTGIQDYSMVENNTVTSDVKKSLEDFSIKAIEQKIDDEIVELNKQNIYTQKDWATSDSVKNIFNSEVGEVKDIVTLNRLDTRKLKYLPLEYIEKQVQENLIGDSRKVKNVKLSNLSNEDTGIKAEVTYDLVEQNNISKERVKEIISNSASTDDINNQIKKEYPNVEKVLKVNEGMNIPIFKKIDVDIIDLN